MEKIVTYSLLENQSDSNQFYTDLSSFTDRILAEAYASLNSYIDDYYSFLGSLPAEIIRTKNEYLLELIMTGIFWKNYIHKADKTKYLSKVVLKRLYHMRKNEALKPTVDGIRGYLAYNLLTKQEDNLVERYDLDAYTNLLEWLTATGEFNEEVIRLNPWLDFYKTKHKVDVESILKSAISFATIFQQIGKEILGKYTRKVPDFLTNAHRYAHREDYFFTTRPEIEYFLNMFGAEILNRQLQAAFERTTKKAILLPTCMRTQPQNGCQAKSDGKELVCKQCHKDCNIGKVAKSLEKEGITPYVIPHSSNFSKFLIKWKDNEDTGLIGVACVLNLLMGGFEMKRLEIASQCLFLDYCGCKKHWDHNGFPTNLNVCKLKQIIHHTPSNTQ